MARPSAIAGTGLKSSGPMSTGPLEVNRTKSSWRIEAGAPSLPEVHRSLPIPTDQNLWRKLLAFAGPGFLVAVGYMDPGNWATDLAAGAKFNYSLLFVIMLSNLMAILLRSEETRLNST